VKPVKLRAVIRWIWVVFVVAAVIWYRKSRVPPDSLMTSVVSVPFIIEATVGASFVTLATTVPPEYDTGPNVGSAVVVEPPGPSRVACAGEAASAVAKIAPKATMMLFLIANLLNLRDCNTEK